ncbi:MAG: VCBS repeat-containing protein [Pirellulaceae bacterium]
MNFANAIEFRTQELTERLTVGYAVQLIDMNDDDRLDIVVLDSKRMLWLENPTWETHVIHATPDAKYDNVCFAPADVDSDGDLDFAIGSDWQFGNTRSGGQIGWLEQAADQWKYHPITSEPTTHRMRWIQLDQGGPLKLVVAPLKGRGTTEPAFAEAGVRLLALSVPDQPASQPWPIEVITDKLHVMHNIDVIDLDNDQRDDLLAASFEGVHWLRHANGEWLLSHLGSGDQTRQAPKLGSSEIRLGTLADDQPVISTIEPWHGDRVVVYLPGDKSSQMWKRFVIDSELAWGHAVSFANLDSDADQELVIGVRDNASDVHRSGVRIYDPVDAKNGKWARLLVDPGGVAVEDLATGDLDKDGRVDIVPR